MTTNQSVDLGSKIRQARERRGLTVIDLVKLSGWSRSYIHQVERGRYANPSIEKLRSIAQALDVNVRDLTEDV